ncbi:MAG: beta-galactosidase [Nibricoccus sp.]
MNHTPMITNNIRHCFIALCLLLTVSVVQAEGAKHTFAIGETDFLLDGKPFVIRCGEIHFPRVPREYWQHRLQMCRALGLNTVCVYLFWNYHEWEEGHFNWTGQADVAEFCRLAQAEGLWVILRPGPYSCAEWEMGGLPWWLVKHDKIALRSTDPKFLEPAKRYLHEVGRVLAPQQITRGGSLLMVQVENEYGSFGKDVEYMGALRQTLLEAGFDVPLFACNPTNALANGYRDDLFQVVNFGAGAAQKAFETLKKFQKTGPLMNGEYYPAWFDVWGRKHRTGAPGPIVADLDYMLKNRHSFSIYMAHGGTSFALWSGADRPFIPDTSSYDYDAPISEAGWVTPKFEAMREVLARYLEPGEKLPLPPAANPVIEIAPFALKEMAPVLDNLPAVQHDETPRTMEFYGQSRGVIVYRTTLPAGPAGVLAAKAVHDYAWLFVDGKQIGVMDRRTKRYRVELPAREKPAQLDMVIEAAGRVNFGVEVYDRKGLHAPVEFGAAREPAMELKNWEIFPLQLGDTPPTALKYSAVREKRGPAFWRGTFEIPHAGDTFLDLHSWGKGVVWVNGHCLGRFWNIGPTQTMYLPGPWLRTGANEIVVLDLIGPREPRLAGLGKPILDELHPELDFARRERPRGAVVTENLTPVASGSFPISTDWLGAKFAAAATGRYLCVEVLSSHGDKSVAALAELDAIDTDGKPVSKVGWKLLWASSEETAEFSGEADNVLDGQSSSSWHSGVSPSPAAPPHRLVIDLGDTVRLSGVRCLPRGGKPEAAGRIKDYKIYLSDTPFGLIVR